MAKPWEKYQRQGVSRSGRKPWEKYQKGAGEEGPAPEQEQGSPQGNGDGGSTDKKSFIENMPAYGQLKSLARSFDDQVEGYRKALSGENPADEFGRALGNLPGGPIAETALTLGTGAAGQVAGGLAGIKDTVTEGPAAGAETVRDVSGAMTYTPRTEGGQQVTRDVGEAVGPAVEAVTETLGQGGVALGRAAGVDSPEGLAGMYAAGQAIPEAAGAALGARAPRIRAKPGRPKAARELAEEQSAPRVEDTAETVGPATTGRADQPEPAGQQPDAPQGQRRADGLEQPRQGDTETFDEDADGIPGDIEQPVWEGTKRAEIRRQIQEGDKDAAKYRIDESGSVVTDPVAKKALKQGFDERSIATIKSASPQDRAAMLRMLGLAERSLKNAKFGARNRPSDVIGDSVMKRFQVVRQANKKARQDVNEAARADLAGKQVDATDVVDGFYDDLGELGVRRTDEGLEFEGSQLEGNKATAAIQRVSNRLKGQADGMELHRLKQYIDRQIDWNKSREEPLDAQAVSTLKSLRGRINDRLKTQSDRYADANERAAETFEAIDTLNDVMPRRFDPEADNIESMVGTQFRKVLGESQNRQPLIQAIDQLDEVAGNYGGKFKDDPINQVVFYSDLEKNLGSFAPNSFQGKLEKSGAQAGVNEAVNAGVRGDTVGAGIGTTRAALNKARGINEENAIKRMRELLQRGERGGPQQ